MEPLPTVLRSGPYRFYFWSHEPDEPPHIHVDRDALWAKFWFGAGKLSAPHGFRPAELRQIQRLIETHPTEWAQAWHRFFDESN